MRPTSHRSRQAAGWRCWVLFAAWFFANSPQSLAVNFLVWAKGVQHFSHQDRLKAEVARVLGGKKLSLEVAIRNAASADPKTPATTPEIVLRKLELFTAVAAAPASPVAEEFRYLNTDDWVPKRAHAEPPVPPPRAAANIS